MRLMKGIDGCNGLTFSSLRGCAFGLTLSAALGQQWEIQGTTDLSNWTSLGTVSTTNGLAVFIDRQATNLNDRFYRAAGQ